MVATMNVFSACSTMLPPTTALRAPFPPRSSCTQPAAIDTLPRSGLMPERRDKPSTGRRRARQA